jgi:hypothetical protein
VDTGRTPQGVDCEPGVIRKSRQASRVGSRLGLDTGIFPKACAGFVGLNKAELAGCNRIDAERFKQLPHFLEFAGIVGRNHQPSGYFAM